MELTTEQMNALFRMRDNLGKKIEDTEAKLLRLRLDLSVVELSIQAIAAQQNQPKRKSLLR